MKKWMVLFFILDMVLASSLVLAFINVTPPPSNPPFVEPILKDRDAAILDKINDYVIDYSEISEEYFNEHYSIISAYKSTFSCDSKRVNWACAQSGSCFNEYDPACNNTYAVHVFYKFNIDNYSALVGGTGRSPKVQYYNPILIPLRLSFIFENDVIIGAFESNAIEPNSVAQTDYGIPKQIPKFREITTIIPIERFNEWLNGCGTFNTDVHPIKLTRLDESENDNLTLYYYGYGKNNLGEDVEFFANLETGESYCKTITMIEEKAQEAGEKQSFFQSIINFFKKIINNILGIKKI